MKTFELIAPCHFGMEAVLKKEILDLGYDITEVQDGRVTFFGDPEAVARVNVFSRTAERILIKVGSFHAETFEELFQGTKALPWEEYIPSDGKFWVAKAARRQGTKTARYCQLSFCSRLTGSALTWINTTRRQSRTLILDISFLGYRTKYVGG